MSRPPPRRRAFAATLAALAGATLSGCLPAWRAAPELSRVAVPPAWREPWPGPAAATAAATAADTAAATAAAAGAVDPQWWRGFGDPGLAALVEAALARNGDVLLAIARVEEARAQAALAQAARLPALNATLGLQADRALDAAGDVNARALQPALQGNWEPDIFGRIRTQARAAGLAYRASAAERDAVRLVVAAATAQNYVALLAFDAQLFITRATVASRSQALRLANDQARVGYISQLQLTQAQSEYQSVLQAVPELELAVRRQENAVRLLAGELPGKVQGGVENSAARGQGLARLRLPPVPAALPSSLLERRPDIAQRALLLAASDAALALRRQAFLPQVTLSAEFGSLFANAHDYDPVSVWSIGGSVLAPLFSGARLAAQYEAAAAQRDQAAFAYRQAVLTAFSEVENALAGVPRLRQQLAHASERRAILARSLGYAHDRYQAGYASYLEELDAQRNLYRVELDLVALQRTEADNLIALYRALGGGWPAGADLDVP